MMFMTPTRRAVLAGAGALLALGPARARDAAFRLRTADTEIPAGGVRLAVPAFNGLAAGPLIEARRGEAVTLAVENALGVPLRFGAQGLRGQSVAGHDTPIPPGETREITLTPPDAGTFLYRARTDDAPQRDVLLSGPLIVDTEAPPVADRDVVLAVNTIVVPGESASAPAQRIVTVNGAPHLELAARPGERLRLRLVNLAPGMVGGARFPKGTRVIAIDGQPCEPFPPFDDAMFLPPLGRTDLVMDVPPSAPAPLLIRDSFDPTIALASITVGGATMPERYLAKALPANTTLPGEIPFRSAVRATWPVNEVPPDPLLRVKSGGSVVLTIDAAPLPRAIILEAHSARLLDRLDDGWKGWWVDTLLIHPDEPARLAFAAEAPGRYAVDLMPLEGEAAPQRAFIEVA